MNYLPQLSRLLALLSKQLKEKKSVTVQFILREREDESVFIFLKS